jgi:D-alanine-D-alanine ligase-like ATP-grasp enzyme
MSRNIILLFGGESDERLVSVASAQAMAVALGSALLWFWDKKGSIIKLNLKSLAITLTHLSKNLSLNLGLYSKILVKPLEAPKRIIIFLF